MCLLHPLSRTVRIEVTRESFAVMSLTWALWATMPLQRNNCLECTAHLLGILRNQPDTIFPRGKWATIQFLEQSIEEQIACP